MNEPSGDFILRLPINPHLEVIHMESPVIVEQKQVVLGLLCLILAASESMRLLKMSVLGANLRLLCYATGVTATEYFSNLISSNECNTNVLLKLLIEHECLLHRQGLD